MGKSEGLAQDFTFDSGVAQGSLLPHVDHLIILSGLWPLRLLLVPIQNLVLLGDIMAGLIISLTLCKFDS